MRIFLQETCEKDPGYIHYSLDSGSVRKANRHIAQPADSRDLHKSDLNRFHFLDFRAPRWMKNRIGIREVAGPPLTLLVDKRLVMCRSWARVINETCLY